MLKHQTEISVLRQYHKTELKESNSKINDHLNEI
jgi:hypothetical protein